MRRTLCLAAVALVWASSAGATPPTMVENVDEPTRHPFQEFAAANCTFAGDCAIVFPAIAAVRALILHSSCSFALASSSAVGLASVGSQNANPRNALPVFANSATSGITSYGINADTYLFVSQTDQPRIDVFGVSAVVQGLICTISGYVP